MADLETRLARQEEKVDIMVRTMQRHFREEKDDKEEILAAIQEIRDYQRNQVGFVRGVVFTITAVMGGLGLAFNFWNTH